MDPNLDLEGHIYEAMLDDTDFALWALEEEPEWFLDLQDTIHIIITTPAYHQLLDRLYEMGVLSPDAVDTAAYGGNLQAVRTLMERGSRPPKLSSAVLSNDQNTIEFALEYFDPAEQGDSAEFIIQRLYDNRQLLRRFLRLVPDYRVTDWQVRHSGAGSALHARDG
jgi:hypothetical protein